MDRGAKPATLSSASALGQSPMMKHTPAPRPFWKSSIKVALIFFSVGAGIEAFMNYTGFYKIVVQKEAERRAQRQLLLDAAMERIRHGTVPREPEDQIQIPTPSNEHSPSHSDSSSSPTTPTTTKNGDS